MRYADALAAFRQYLEERGLTAEDLDAQAAVTAMLGFYADERATDVELVWSQVRAATRFPT